MKNKYLVLAAAVAALIVGLGCEEITIDRYSQADWTVEGWKAFFQEDYEQAELCFGNAMKEDPYYVEAIAGMGWTYIRTDRMLEAVGAFENAVLAAETPGTPLYVKQAVYMGAATAFLASDEYGLSAERGRYMADNLLTSRFELKGDPKVTDFDLFVVLALDYFGLGDSQNCVWAINKMRGQVGEPTNYSFSNWSAAAVEIERLVNKDPS